MFFATSGSSFFIGEARPGWEAQRISGAAFADEGWIEVGDLTNLGRISGEWQTQEVVLPNCEDPDEPPMPTHDKSVRPARTMQVIVNMDDNDAGQLAMLNAEDSVNAFAFRVVLPDGATRMFIAIVVGAEQVFEDANSVASYAFSLILQSNVVGA